MTLASSVPLTVRGHGRPVNDFDRRVHDTAGSEMRALTIDTVQVNIGLRCNLACHHCHVESSPARKEEMGWETMLLVMEAAGRAGAKTLDITGGAPEMHPRFRWLVEAAIHRGLEVILRTNLTILLQDGLAEMPQFLADKGVHLIASLPCYLETNVDKQRGHHVYRESIAAIQMLNRLGFGVDPRLLLDLVYNPGGPSLPPPQEKLEQDYRRELFNRFGIHFNRLYTITNVPIGRFLHDLKRAGKADQYEQLLRNSFNPATLEGLMCRHHLHVGWDGTMYDCDFNFAIGLPVNDAKQHVRDFDPATFVSRRIATGGHCFACAAGCGSSCGGALV